ncbi:hypothetical protein BBJ28_00014667 [Nothophytophthora sp. Chile5]|nr:hypothetical protein BBJ28_00014667 [Nothophytophthora sp. Chile5]
MAFTACVRALSRRQSTRKTPLRRMAALMALSLLFSALYEPVGASECSACGYLAKNCSSSSSSLGSSADAASISVCDATGGIQIDDVFCDDAECNCAEDRQCVSTVVGCSNLFQARSRRRCLSNATVAQRFENCAVAQDLTTLNATNLASDWVFFKEAAKCLSTDCEAVRQFQQSGLVQCGNLLVAWKTNSSSESEDAGYTGSGFSATTTTYHFVADGSRGSDMSAGTFHYSAPWSAASAALLTAQANSSAIDSCYALQTRNQPNGTCDGVYLQFDASVQFSNSDDYVMSKLSWPEWIAVVGSVAAAVAAVAIVAVVIYRFQHLDLSPPVDEDENGGLLGELDDLSTRKKLHASPARLSPTSPSSRKGSATPDLRQRASGSSSSGETTSTVEMEAGNATTAL